MKSNISGMERWLSVYCSSRGPRLCFQHTVGNCSSRGSGFLSWPPMSVQSRETLTLISCLHPHSTFSGAEDTTRALRTPGYHSMN